MELFSLHNAKKWVHNPLLNLSVDAKFDQIASVNAPTRYSTAHYLSNSSRQINHRCESTLAALYNDRENKILYFKFTPPLLFFSQRST